MIQSLSEFFLKVTGKEMLPFQKRFGAAPFTPTLLIVPTGLGKTDTALVPWLHAVAIGDAKAPSRLIFTLPRQNLTEQVAEVARQRVQSAGLDSKIAVLELMGGSADTQRTVAPDKCAIIVGTQDILISRAVNRGYARRPFRWPIDFALLNNDCLWIFDEVQLMSDSLSSSTQLAAFREQFGVFGRVPCTWMSATVDPEWLNTVDFAPLAPHLRIVRLEAEDRASGTVQTRTHAPKQIAAAPKECRTPESCAAFLLSLHKRGERSLVIVNTVPRAREIAHEIHTLGKGIEVVLLHSRFRPSERRKQVSKLQKARPEGQIIVSTQVIEAGIDMSVQRLITDVAPWGSLVQRFGRVNRYGERSDAEILWVDRPLTSKSRTMAEAETLKPKEAAAVYAPYDPVEVDAAIQQLRGLRSASSADLPEVNGPAPWQYVLRRADLMDLFDTSSDLSGNEIDVSRFIRSGEQGDCYLAWRDWTGDKPPSEMPRLDDVELCPVPIFEARDYGKKHDVFGWNFLIKAWERVEHNRWYPGMVAVTHISSGGYTAEEGWLPGSKVSVIEATRGSEEPEPAFGDDPRSWLSCRQTLRDHTEMVVAAMRDLLDRLPELGLGPFSKDLQTAAAKHDWGKAHDVMQHTLHNRDKGTGWTELLAKQERGKGARGHTRRHFRHELASALAMLSNGDSNLAAYLVAAHHGRIRVTLRSMPRERDDGGQPIARGIREGDRLPACELTGTVRVLDKTLTLDAMQLGYGVEGARSWTERAIRLRDELGPFRLAFLEMLLRTADEQASEKADRQAPCTS